jgi:hypothetical protein
MTRTLYRGLLWLHPPAFRREFAGEMLWIFEEAAAGGVAPLFADGLLSLLRQWLLRSGPWKLAAAVIGGLLEVTAGGLGGLLFGRSPMMAHLATAQVQRPVSPAEALAMNNLIHVAMWAVMGVLLMVVVLVFWVKGLNSRRIHCLSTGPRELRNARAGTPAWPGR